MTAHKGQKKSKWLLKDDVSSKKGTYEFYFTTMKPQVDLFSFVFWNKLKTPKKHFEINWPLAFFRAYLATILKALPASIKAKGVKIEDDLGRGWKKDGGYDWEPWKCFDTSSLYTVTEKWDFVASYVSREKIIHFLHGDYLLRVAATTTQQQEFSSNMQFSSDKVEELQIVEFPD